VKREEELEAAVQRLSAALRQSHQQRRLLVQQLGMLRSKYGEGDPRAEVRRGEGAGRNCWLNLPTPALLLFSSTCGSRLRRDYCAFALSAMQGKVLCAACRARYLGNDQNMAC
jgi:hypothetical protein